MDTMTALLLASGHSGADKIFTPDGTFVGQSSESLYANSHISVCVHGELVVAFCRTGTISIEVRTYSFVNGILGLINAASLAVPLDDLRTSESYFHPDGQTVFAPLYGPGGGYFMAIDVSDPANVATLDMTPATSSRESFSQTAVNADGAYIYYGGSDSDLYTVSWDNTLKTLGAETKIPNATRAMTIVENGALCTGYYTNNTLIAAFDITSNPQVPVVQDSLPTDGSTGGLASYGNFAVKVHSQFGAGTIQAIDATDPNILGINPPLALSGQDGLAVVVLGAHAYVTGTSLGSVDLTDPAALVQGPVFNQAFGAPVAQVGQGNYLILGTTAGLYAVEIGGVWG